MRNLFIVILSLVSFCANAQYDYLSAKKILVSQSFRPGPDTTVNPLWVGEIRQSVEGGVGKIWICISLTGQKWQQISGSGGGGGDVASVFGRTGAVSALQADYAAFYEPIISTGTTLQYIRGDKSLATLNTSVVPESGNLYFTSARARGAISLTTTGTSGAATYNSTTGVLNIPAYEAGSGTVTNIATNTATGITGGPITTTGTLAIDTNLLKTHASHKKAIDSLGALIGANNITVTNIGADGVRLAHTEGDTLNISRVRDSTTASGTINWVKNGDSTVTAYLSDISAGGMTNPMTTEGDIIYGGASGTPTRLPAGSTNEVLTISGGVPTWLPPTPAEDIAIAAYQALGSSIKAQTIGTTIDKITANTALGDGIVRYQPVFLTDSTVVTGAMWFMVTAGSYTSDQYNGIGLYKFRNDSLILVASTTSAANHWNTASNGFQTRAFTSTYSAERGLYYIGLLYNSSAQTTAPTIGTVPTILSGVSNANIFTTGNKVSAFSAAGQNSLPTAVSMASQNSSSVLAWVGVY